MTDIETFQVLRTDNHHPDFITLVQLLDKELWQRNGSDMDFFQKFNIINDVDTVVVAYHGNEAAGCGCFKKFDNNSVEIKRMFVIEAKRKSGIASSILNELESWAKELNYLNIVLETGIRLPEAVNLYLKNGYEITEKWGQYIGVENSICMRKQLNTT